MSKAKDSEQQKQITVKVEALLKKMSLEEKIGQLNQVGGAAFSPGPAAEDQTRIFFIKLRNMSCINVKRHS